MDYDSETGYMFIERALDSNAFDTGTTAAGHVNPEYWEKNLRDHVRANLVAVQMGEDRSAELAGDGDKSYVTIMGEPTAAVATAESDAASISALSTSQVALEPTEYTKAYEYSDKEARRAFFNVLDRLTSNIGYSLALAADSAVITELGTNAGNAVLANGVAAASALASSDTIDHVDVINAMKANVTDKFSNHRGLICSVGQAHDLMQDSTFLTVDKYGQSNATNLNGLRGFTAFGIPIFETTQISEADNEATAFLISAPDAFVYSFKNRGDIRTEYHALDRKTQVVGAIDFDVAVARANAICKITTYVA